MTLNDSKGKGSKTLFFVSISWAALVFAFIYSQFGESPFGLQDFGVAVTAVLAPWVGREWKEAHYDSGRN